MEISKDKNFNWIPLAELAFLAFCFIALYIHSDNKFERGMEAMMINQKQAEKRTDKIIEGMRQDILVFHKENAEMMRDFHGRLCAIEERNKK